MLKHLHLRNNFAPFDQTISTMPARRMESFVLVPEGNNVTKMTCISESDGGPTSLYLLLKMDKTYISRGG